MVPEEHHLSVTRTARYWTLGPADEPTEVWFVLHGYKQLARRFLRRFESIDDGERLIVAPEALSRFYVSPQEGRHGAASMVGATWMTREDRDHEIRDYVGYLDALSTRVLGDVRAPPPGGVTVLGFSQGVATATRWVVRGRMRPQRLVLWGDFTPPDLDLGAARSVLRSIPMTLVRGRSDRALSSGLASEEAERLQAAGLRPELIRYEGGHDIDGDTLRRIAGVADQGRSAT
jgi:predicted esterase